MDAEEVYKPPTSKPPAQTENFRVNYVFIGVVVIQAFLALGWPPMGTSVFLLFTVPYCLSHIFHKLGRA
jgi:hypothetical protein